MTSICGTQNIDVCPMYCMYHIVASSNMSHLEAHPTIYRLLMNGIFDAYVPWPFDKKFILITNSQLYGMFYFYFILLK